MPKLTEEQIAKLKAENPGQEIHSIEIDEEDLTVVLRAPSEPIWRSYEMAQLGAQESGMFQARKDFVMNCLVFPTPLELFERLAKRPGMVNVLAGELREVAGALLKARRKKL